MPAVNDRADEIRTDTLRAASHAGPNGKAALIAERDGACAAMAHDVDVATLGGSASGAASCLDLEVHHQRPVVAGDLGQRGGGHVHPRHPDARR